MKISRALGSLLLGLFSGCIDSYRLGMLVKTFNNEFFQLAEQGCTDYAKLSNSTCIYRGPLPTDEAPNPDPNGTLQADMLYDLIEEGIDGLAVSVKNAQAIAPAINQAIDMGIPVVTFDSDAENSRRISYIGTDNEFMGQTLAKVSKQIMPQGGTFAVLMSDDATNMLQRKKAFQDEMLAESTDGNKLWTELPDSPFDFNRDLDVALEQMERFAQQNVTVLTSTTGGPMWHEGYPDFVNRHRFRNITIVLSDDFPLQINYLSRAYAQGLVGQMPYEMGYRSANALLDLLKGREVPKSIGTNLISHIQVPLELPELVVDANLIGGLHAVGYILFSFVAFAVICCICWTLYYRKLAVVKAAQPTFLLLVAAGIMMMGASLIPMTMDDNGHPDELSEREGALICMSVPWLACCGFTITFSALFSKMRRFNTLLKASQGFTRLEVKTTDMLGPFVVLLTLNVIILSLWTGIDPLLYVRENNAGTDGWNRILSTYGACRSENVAWYLVPLGFINLGVLVYANYQAYVSRNVQSEFSESKFIWISMISLLQALLTGFPVVYVVRNSPPAYYLVTSFMIFVVCMAILLLIFIPKMIVAEDFSKKSDASQRRIMINAIRRSSVAGSSSGSMKTLRKSNENIRGSSGEIILRNSAGARIQNEGDQTMSSHDEHPDRKVRFDDIEEPMFHGQGEYGDDPLTTNG